jgi:hypothetical protein
MAGQQQAGEYPWLARRAPALGAAGPTCPITGERLAGSGRRRRAVAPCRSCRSIRSLPWQRAGPSSGCLRRAAPHLRRRQSRRQLPRVPESSGGRRAAGARLRPLLHGPAAGPAVLGHHQRRNAQVRALAAGPAASCPSAGTATGTPQRHQRLDDDRNRNRNRNPRRLASKPLVAKLELAEAQEARASLWRPGPGGGIASASCTACRAWHLATGVRPRQGLLLSCTGVALGLLPSALHALQHPALQQALLPLLVRLLEAEDRAAMHTRTNTTAACAANLVHRARCRRRRRAQQRRGAARCAPWRACGRGRASQPRSGCRPRLRVGARCWPGAPCSRCWRSWSDELGTGGRVRLAWVKARVAAYPQGPSNHGCGLNSGSCTRQMCLLNGRLHYLGRLPECAAL